MKIIKSEELTVAIREMCMNANYHLPKDMKDAICTCREHEPFDIAKKILGKIEENFNIVISPSEIERADVATPNKIIALIKQRS